MQLHVPHGPFELGRRSQFLREVFWVLALGVVVVYAFFVALGAFAPGSVAGVTAVVGVLAALYVGHAWLQSRHAAQARDPRLTSARERRGF